MKKMELLDLVWLILAILIGSYAFVFGLLRKLNEIYYVSKLGRKKRHSLPPGDMGWPLIGNMLSFIRAFKSSDPDTFISSLINRYGKKGIYKSHLFGSPSIIVCAPETCRQVLMDIEQFKKGHPAATKRLMGENMFTHSNEEHKRLRKLTTSPIKGDKALKLYIGYIEDLVITSLDEVARLDRPVEFLLHMKKLTFKIITHIFLGSTSDSLNVLGSMEKYYTDILHGLKSRAINIPGFAFHKALKGRKKLVNILQTIMDERRAMSESEQQRNKGMIDLMMKVEDDENGGGLEDEYIINLLIGILLAGHESTAHAMTWALIYLHQHPEVHRKAKEEQEEIIKKRSSTTHTRLSFEEIKQMEYLIKVINEILRIANISLTAFREAKVDVNVQGYIVPKGWKVLVWNRGVHMDPEIYSHPKQYDPSRWDNHVTRPGDFIPFGGGSWICPGADLTKLELCVFLHYFLLNYKFEPVNPRCPVAYLPLPKPSDNCLANIIKLTK